MYGPASRPGKRLIHEFRGPIREIALRVHIRSTDRCTDPERLVDAMWYRRSDLVAPVA